MTVTYRGAGGTSTGNINSAGFATLTAPSGTTAGDQQIALIKYDGSGVTWTLTGPGWTRTATGAGLDIWTRTAPSTGSYNTTITPSGNTNYAAAILGYIGVTGLDSSLATGTLTAPAVTAGGSGIVARVAGVLRSVSGKLGEPSGTTSRLQVTNPVSSSVYLLLDAVDATQTAAGSTGTASYTASGGYVSAAVATLMLYGDRPPNAPTPTSPSGNPTVNRLQPYTFAATFSDPDAGDSPSRFWMRYRSTTASPTPSWTVVSQTGTSQQWTAPGSYFAADHYEFQFAYQDSQGAPSSDTTQLAWSASTFAYFATPSNAPTITSPTNGAPIGQASVTVTFSQPTLDQFRYYVTDAAGNSIVTLTTVTDPNAVAARQFTITGLANNTSIKTYVATHDANGWTSYAESDNTVSYTPPAVTSVTLTPSNTPPTITTAFNTAAGSSSVSATTSVLIEYSRDAGATVEHSSIVQAVNGIDVFLTPAGNRFGTLAYSVRVTAQADNGTSAATGWIT